MILGLIALPAVLGLGGHTSVARENPKISQRAGVEVEALVVGGCQREDSFHFGVCETRVSYFDRLGINHQATLSVTDFVRQSDDALLLRYDRSRPERATFVRGNPTDFERYMTVGLFALAGCFYAFGGAALFVRGLRWIDESRTRALRKTEAGPA
jgi:hypothetical protein